jgi:hydroxysqualene synthase
MTSFASISLPFSNADLIALSQPNGGRFGVTSTADAYTFCKRLARAHYENFPVGSLLISKHLQPHFFSVYAFSRLADDIADELGNNNRTEKFAALARLEEMLLSSDQNLANPILRALQETIREKNLPVLPFQKLLMAFRMDADFRQARDFADLEHYCAHSANPIGEIVLRLYDFYTPERAAWSEAVCTGLQCANFWQDFSRDIPNGRIFIPSDVLAAYSLRSEDMYHFFANHEKIPLKIVRTQFLPCFDVLFERTKVYFTNGSRLLAIIPDKRLRAELALTIAGGEQILAASYALGFRILKERPKLSLNHLMMLCWRSFRLFVR